MKSFLAITLLSLLAATSALEVRNVTIVHKDAPDSESVFDLDSSESKTAYLEFFYNENDPTSSKKSNYELRFAFTVNQGEPKEDDGIEAGKGFEIILNHVKLFENWCKATKDAAENMVCTHHKKGDEVQVFLSLDDMNPDFDGEIELRALGKNEPEVSVAKGAKAFKMQPFLRCTQEIVQPELKMDDQACRVIVSNAEAAGCPGLTYPAPSWENLVITPDNLDEFVVNVDGIRLNSQRVMSEKSFALYTANFEEAYVKYTKFTDKMANIELTVSYVDVNQKQEEKEDAEPFTFEFNKGCHDFSEFCVTQNETALPPVWSSNLPSFVHVTGLVCHMNFSRPANNSCRDEIVPEANAVATLTFGCEEGCDIKWDVDDYEAENAKFKCDADSLEWIPDSENPGAMKEWFTCDCAVSRQEDGAASMASSIALITLAALIALFRP